MLCLIAKHAPVSMVFVIKLMDIVHRVIQAGLVQIVILAFRDFMVQAV